MAPRARQPVTRAMTHEESFPRGAGQVDEMFHFCSLGISFIFNHHSPHVANLKTKYCEAKSPVSIGESVVINSLFWIKPSKCHVTHISWKIYDDMINVWFLDNKKNAIRDGGSTAIYNLLVHCLQHLHCPRRLNCLYCFHTVCKHCLYCSNCFSLFKQFAQKPISLFQ